MRPCLKNTYHKRPGAVAQDVGLEFNPSTAKQTNKIMNKQKRKNKERN
jgi:hypothetical protein